MKKKFLSMLLTTSIITSITNPIISIAEESKEVKSKGISITDNNSKSSEDIKNSSVTQFGFLSYLYTDTNFNDLSSIKFNVNSNELINNNKIKSAKFIGYIRPLETKTYQFSTSNNDNCVLKVNNKLLINKKTNNSIELEQGKLYPIEISLSGDINNFELFFIDSNLNKQEISKEEILLPNDSNNTTPIKVSYEITSIPEVWPPESNNILSRNSGNSNNISFDSDKDGIPDEWEINGYTYKDREILKWSDELNPNHYRKYVSNPDKSRTANDPYTDMQKVIGQMPAATKFEARDPMIPAVPIISVGMEKLLITNNQDVSSGTASSKSITTGSGDSTSNTASISSGVSYSSKDGLTIGVSSEYSNTTTTMTYTENNDSNSWSEDLGINTAESAFLNANIRYYNTGTAPIYELRPTTNFVLNNSKDSIATIRSGPNQIGNSLSPGTTYPREGLTAISLDTANENGLSKIAIDVDTLNNLQKGIDNINLETSQYSGIYGTIDSDGNLLTPSSNAWSPILSEIEATSANIIMKTDKSLNERFVTTASSRDLNDRTPILTIGEAIKKAYDLQERNGNMYYLDDKEKKEYIISEKTITAIFDQATSDRVNELLKNSPDKGFFDLPIEKGMKMTIIPSEFFDAGTKDMWSGLNSTSSDNKLGISISQEMTLKKKLSINNDSDYLISFSLNGPPQEGKLRIVLQDDKGNRIIQVVNHTILNNNSTMYNVLISSNTISGNNTELSIANFSDFGSPIVYLRDIKVTKLRKSNKIGGVSQIISKRYTNKALDGDLHNRKVILYDSHNNNNQKWDFQYHSDKNAYVIKNMANNSVMTANETNVELHPFNPKNNNQYWILEKTNEKDYFIIKPYMKQTHSLQAYDGNKIGIYGNTQGNFEKFKLK